MDSVTDTVLAKGDIRVTAILVRVIGATPIKVSFQRRAGNGQGKYPASCRCAGPVADHTHWLRGIRAGRDDIMYLQWNIWIPCISRAQGKKQHRQ